MNKKSLLLLIPFAAVALAGCGPNNNDDKQCESAQVTVDKSSATLKVNETLNLNGKIDKEGCSITWSSDNDSIASVANGIVTAHAPGVAKISANGKVVCTITVEAGDLPITVHAGTLEDPFDAADAVTVANSLQPGASTNESFYIKGAVAANPSYNSQYGDYSFYIGGLQCWQLKNGPSKAKFNNGDIEEGDTVTVYSKLTKYHEEGKEDKAEAKDGYVYHVQKAGEAEPTSIKEVKTCPESIEQNQQLKAEDIVIVLNLSDGGTKEVHPTSVECDTSKVGDAVEVTLGYLALPTIKTSIKVTEAEKGSVYTFINEKQSVQNFTGNPGITQEQFLAMLDLNGDVDVITGFKDPTNAYIGGNGGQNDTAWALYECLRVGKSNAQGQITLTLDEDVDFTKIRVTVLCSNTNGELTINGVTKALSKKAVKGDLVPETIDFDITGKIGELNLKSKNASSGNYGALITSIQFINASKEELVLDHISLNTDNVKKEYYVGDPFDPEGLVVTAHYEGGKTKEIASGYEIDPETFEAAGDSVPVTITYGGKDASFNVKVNEARTISTVTIVDYPEEITEGDNITADDVLVDVAYSSGDPDEGIHPDSVLLGEVLDGKADLTATVGDVTSEAVKVTVKAKEVYTPVTLSKDDAVLGYDATFNEVAGVKLGTSNAAGSINLTLPKGTNKLSFYAVGWNNVDTKVTLSGLGQDKELDVVKDSGMSGSGTDYTLQQEIETFHIIVNLDSPLATQTRITIAATTGTRFGIWDAGVKTEEIHVTNVEVVGYPDSIYVGDILTKEDIFVDVTYDKAPKQEGVNPDSFTLDTSKAGTAQLTATVGDFTSDPIDVEILEERYVTGVTIVDYPEEITEGDEISVLDILVDVTYSVGEDSKGIHPDSYSLSVPVGGKASLTAVVDDVTSDAVEVTVKKADVITPIDIAGTGTGKATDAVVIVDGVEHTAVKLENRSSKGTSGMEFEVPAGAKKLIFCAASWNGTASTLTLAGFGDNVTYTLKSDTGISNNSPFTLSTADLTNFKYIIELDEPLTSDATVVVSGTVDRSVVWDVGVVVEEKTVTGIEITDWPKSVEQGAVIAKEDVKVTLTYDDGTSKTDATPNSISCDTSEIGTAKLTATAGEVTSAEVDVTVTEPITVTSVEITNYPESVSQNASIEAKDVKVTVSYSNGSSEDDVTPDSVACDTSKIGTAKLTATVGGVTSDPVDVTVKEASAKFTKLTKVDDVVSGTYVVAALVGDDHIGIGSAITLTSSKIKNCETVTVNNGTISTDDAEDFALTIEVVNGVVYIKDSNNKYLGYSSSTNLSLSDTAYEWQIEAGKNGTFRIYSKASTTRALSYRAGDQNCYGAYSTTNITSGSTEYFDLELFKL